MKTSLDLEQILNECDAQIRLGKAPIASRQLRLIKPSALNRSQLARFAQLCRRVGQVHKGLAALSPVVRPNHRAHLRPATATEKAEYAVLLQRAGAVVRHLNY